MKRAPRWSVVIVAVLGTVTNLPALIFSVSLLGSWVRLHVSGVPHFNYGYLSNGAPWLVGSSLGLVTAGVTLLKRSSPQLLAIVSLALGLVGLSILPNVGPRLDLAEATTRLLGHADHSLSDWADSHGSFPADERELREALAIRPLREPAIFSQDGRPIPYDVRIVSNAFGPALEPVPPDPGTLVYAVSSDHKEYWLIITTLRNPVGGPVVVNHIAGEYDPGEVLVMHRKRNNPGARSQGFIE
jgi:hypothetical protein